MRCERQAFGTEANHRAGTSAQAAFVEYSKVTHRIAPWLGGFFDFDGVGGAIADDEQVDFLAVPIAVKVQRRLLGDLS